MKFYTVIAGFATLMALLALLIIESYQWILIHFPNAIYDVWTEKSFLLLLAMALTAMVSIMEWQVMFLDQQDHAILGTLPIKNQTIFKAKLTSLMLFVLAIALAFTLIPSMAIGLAINPSNSLLYGFLRALGDSLCAILACLTVFFFSGILNGILNFFFSPKIYRILSILLLIFSCTFFIIAIPFYYKYIDLIKNLKATSSSAIFYFPQLWFIGLGEIIGGSNNPIFNNLAAFGLLSLFFLMTGFVFLSFITYKKNRSIIPWSDTSSSQGITIWFRRIFDKFILYHPLQRSVFYFIKNGLLRIAEVRMQLALYLAVGLAIDLAVIGNWLLYKEYYNINFNQVNIKLLSLPYPFIFLLIFSIRLILNTPKFLNANWVIRLSERPPKKHYIKGLDKAIFFILIFPSHLLIFGSYWLLWDLKGGIIHTLFCLFFTLLLKEILFFKYHKFPFACPHNPNKNTLAYHWALRIIGFYLFFKLASLIEFALFHNIPGIMIFGIIGIIILFLIKYLKFKKPFSFTFDDQPENYILSLNLQGEDY